MQKTKLFYFFSAVLLFSLVYTVSSQDKVTGNPLDAKSYFKSFGVISPETSYTLGDSCAVTNPEKHDGYGHANGYGWLADSGRFVIKFSPLTVGHTLPWKYNKVCIGLQGLSGTPTNVPYCVVIYDSTSSGPGNLLYCSPVYTASSIPPFPATTWFSSPDTFTVTHAVYIGIRIRLSAAPYTLTAADENTSTPLWPGYTSSTSPPTPWSTIQSVGSFAAYRCMAIRCEGAAPVPPAGWVEQVSGSTLYFNCVSAVTDQVGWIGAGPSTGSPGQVLRTTNAGTNWVDATGGTPISSQSVYAICGIDANTCLCTTSPSATYIYKTTNGGANWTQVYTAPTPGFIDNIAVLNSSTIIAQGDPVGGRWELYKSTNLGSTWDSTGMYLPQAASEAGWNNNLCVRGNNVWFGTNNTRVYYSTNGGVTGSWNFSATTGDANQFCIAFNGSTGFCGEASAFTSTNSGVSWSTVTVPGTGTIQGFSNAFQEFWYARGTNIYYSSNNGANFASQYLSPSSSTYWSMSFVIYNGIVRGWAVTTNGHVSMYNEVLVGINNHNTNEVPKDYLLSQNYPNPFNPTTVIEYQVPKSTNVSLVVYDLLGREVQTLVSDFKQAGSYKIEFNASNLSSGVYFYKLIAGDFVTTKKMMLIK